AILDRIGPPAKRAMPAVKAIIVPRVNEHSAKSAVICAPLKRAGRYSVQCIGPLPIVIRKPAAPKRYGGSCVVYSPAQSLAVSAARAASTLSSLSPWEIRIFLYSSVFLNSVSSLLKASKNSLSSGRKLKAPKLRTGLPFTTGSLKG